MTNSWAYEEKSASFQCPYVPKVSATSDGSLIAEANERSSSNDETYLGIAIKAAETEPSQYWKLKMFFAKDELIPRAVVMELHFSEITYWWSLKFCLVVLCMRTVLRSPRPYRVIFLIRQIPQIILQSPGLLWFEFGAPLKPRMQGPLPLPWWATAQRIFPVCTYQ